MTTFFIILGTLPSAFRAIFSIFHALATFLNDSIISLFALSSAISATLFGQSF
jgi:hypothetical protein